MDYFAFIEAVANLTAEVYHVLHDHEAKGPCFDRLRARADAVYALLLHENREVAEERGENADNN